MGRWALIESVGKRLVGVAGMRPDIALLGHHVSGCFVWPVVFGEGERVAPPGRHRDHEASRRIARRGQDMVIYINSQRYAAG